MRRSLSAEEATLWARVLTTVRPLRPVVVKPVAAKSVASRPAPASLPAKPPAPPPGTPKLRVQRAAVLPVRAPVSVPVPRQPVVQNTLDGGWDKRIARGIVMPDVTIDLHGHTLSSAHAMLDAGIDRALRSGARVILLVTGRPPRAESERPHARGAIRAAVGDWIGSSRHADRVAAVRGAHPRHGGAGALYLVLRRGRER